MQTMQTLPKIPSPAEAMSKVIEALEKRVKETQTEIVDLEQQISQLNKRLQTLVQLSRAYKIALDAEQGKLNGRLDLPISYNQPKSAHILNLLAEAGEDGLTSHEVRTRLEKSGISVSPSYLNPFLSREKRKGRLEYKNGKYRVTQGARS